MLTKVYSRIFKQMITSICNHKQKKIKLNKRIRIKWLMLTKVYRPIIIMINHLKGAFTKSRGSLVRLLIRALSYWVRKKKKILTVNQLNQHILFYQMNYRNGALNLVLDDRIYSKNLVNLSGQINLIHPIGIIQNSIAQNKKISLNIQSALITSPFMQ